MAAARCHFQHGVASPKRLVGVASDEVRPMLLRLIETESDARTRLRVLNLQMPAGYG